MQVALLRGINVGGKNLVPMRELQAVFIQAGCQDVRTYIQSGNVLFEAGPVMADQLSSHLSAAIKERFGCRVPVVVRTAEEMLAVLASNPFFRGDEAAEISEDSLHVYFLSQQPTAKQTATLDAARSLPDEFALQGREIFLRLPNGMARTKLTNAYFDSKLASVCTARNWRTVKKLHELMTVR